MALATSNLIVKLAPLPGIMPNAADQAEATSEHIYNLAQDTTRTGYKNLLNHGSSQSFNDGRPQFINAQGGNDTVTIIGDAADTVHAGSGNDTVDGGGGNDKLYGGTGNDTLLGNYGNDTLSGGYGDDTLDGGYGNDSLSGGSGADSLAGGEDHDSLNGGSGDDTLFGGNGRDTLNGGTGNDTLYGDKTWADVFFTGAANTTDANSDDVLRGGDGDDYIVGGEGADVMTGGAGADTFGYNAFFDFSTPSATDVITDFNRAEGDKIDLLLVEGPCLSNSPYMANEREFLHFTDGPSDEARSLWLGDTNASGDQMVYINWNDMNYGAPGADGSSYDYAFKVHVGIGQTLIESDFLF